MTNPLSRSITARYHIRINLIVSLSIKRREALGAGLQVKLEPGENSLALVVQAENGTKKTYTVTVHRQAAVGDKETAPTPSFSDIKGHWAESRMIEAAVILLNTMGHLEQERRKVPLLAAQPCGAG